MSLRKTATEKCQACFNPPSSAPGKSAHRIVRIGKPAIGPQFLDVALEYTFCDDCLTHLLPSWGLTTESLLKVHEQEALQPEGAKFHVTMDLQANSKIVFWALQLQQRTKKKEEDLLKSLKRWHEGLVRAEHPEKEDEEMKQKQEEEEQDKQEDAQDDDDDESSYEEQTDSSENEDEHNNNKSGDEDAVESPSKKQKQARREPKTKLVKRSSRRIAARH